jgi:hypothetical protein
MPRLVALGDSMTQGVSSGAVWKSSWSYPAIVARAMGLRVGAGEGFDFCVPHFGLGGMPLNLERLLHDLDFALGGPGLDLVDWLLAARPAVEEWLEERDEYYEHGFGARARSYPGPYHLLACFGFTVSDLFTVDGQFCDRIVRERRWDERSELLERFPSSATHRAARRVLNPASRYELNRLTLVDWLGRIEERQGPVENLILAVGLNNAAGCITRLEVVETGPEPPAPEIVEEFSLWHPRAFEVSYRRLAERMAEKTRARVFAATLPYVTDAPLIRGAGPRDRGPRGDHHEYYVHFYLREENPSKERFDFLTAEEVLRIEEHQDAYNEVIRATAREYGWRVVDLAGLVNGLSGRGEYTPDAYLRRFLGDENHPLLGLKPPPRMELFRSDAEGRRTGGGLVSLDCFHGTTTGFALIAELFVREMLAAGVEFRDAGGKAVPPGGIRLPWERIRAVDHLLENPPRLWADLLRAGEHLGEIWERIGGVISIFRP